MHRELEINWAELLNGFAGQLNPLHENIFEQYPASYYWTCYQSEWATGMVFREADFLKRLLPLLVRHGMLSFSSADVMRYFGRRVGVLRGAETTINAVQDFRACRTKEGGPEEDLQWRSMRKGIAGLHRRTEVSQKANERLLNALARRVRALCPWGKDKDLLAAVNHGEFLINGFRNRDLQALLYATPAESPAERRRRSSAISRKLRLLPAHGLIQKVPCTHRYHVTATGRTILVAVLTTASTTVHQLNQLPKAA